MSGRKFRWLMITVGFESGEARVVGGLVGGGSGGLGRPVVFPSEVTGKGCCISDQAKMIEGGCGEKERPLLRTEASEGVRG